MQPLAKPDAASQAAVLQQTPKGYNASTHFRPETSVDKDDSCQ
jgi:hypothetical protein